jgi:hypothetical protein
MLAVQSCPFVVPGTGRSFVSLSLVVGGGMDRAWPQHVGGLLEGGCLVRRRPTLCPQPRTTALDINDDLHRRNPWRWLDYHRTEVNGGPPRHFHLVLHLLEHRPACLTASSLCRIVRTRRLSLAKTKCAVQLIPMAAAPKRTMAAVKK